MSETVIQHKLAATLRFNNVTVSFEQDKPIFKNFTIDFLRQNKKKGHITALMGGSGIGKSTILKLFADIAYRQSYLIEGKIETVGDGEVAYIPQEPVLIQAASVAANINLFDKIKQQEQFIDLGARNRIIELLGIHNLLDRPTISGLSGGERQRVMLARSLSLKPNILLLDEPASKLDPILKMDLLADIRKIVDRENIMAIFVTHDINEVRLIADGIVFMEPHHKSNVVSGNLPEISIEKFFLQPPSLLSTGYIHYPYFSVCSTSKIKENYDGKLIEHAVSLGVSGSNIKQVPKSKGTSAHVIAVYGDSVFIELWRNFVVVVPKNKIQFGKVGETVHVDVSKALHFFDTIGKRLP